MSKLKIILVELFKWVILLGGLWAIGYTTIYQIYLFSIDDVYSRAGRIVRIKPGALVLRESKGLSGDDNYYYNYVKISDDVDVSTLKLGQVVYYIDTYPVILTDKSGTPIELHNKINNK